MKTIITIVSEEQQEAFRRDRGYKSHFGYNYNYSDEVCAGGTGGTAYATGSYDKIWAAVRDYYNTRDWQ